MIFGYLADMVANIPNWVAMIVTQPELDVAPPGGPQQKREPMNDSAAFVAALDKSMSAARSALQQTTDEHLMTGWRLLAGGKPVIESSRYIMIRDTINHWVHHPRSDDGVSAIVGRQGPSPVRPVSRRQEFLDDMAGRECYHCKQWVEDGEAHDCWTTTEAALTADSAADLRDAWSDCARRRRVRRPTDLCLAQLGHVLAQVLLLLRAAEEELSGSLCVSRPALKAPQVRRSGPSSKSKFFNIIQLRHRDEVEAPITDWLREAYDHSESLATRSGGPSDPPKKTKRSTVRTRERRSAPRRTPKRPSGRPRPARSVRNVIE
jgi:hypothetical protein